MWKKNEPETASPPTPRPAAPPRAETAGAPATIGPSIVIKGDLAGEEDLVVQGRIEGKITLRKHNVTVGKAGRVKADIHGRSIRVEGDVEGNLFGEQDVVIRASGRVQGNLVAPRVTLENGSQFKGSIDMEPAGRETAAAGKPTGGAGPRPSGASTGPNLKEPGAKSGGQPATAGASTGPRDR